MKSNVVKMRCKQGFTLIELLVVVLIIGILAAVALPQYNKAVRKTRMANQIAILDAIYPAVASCYLRTGNIAQCQLADLDLEIDTVCVPWDNGLFDACNQYGTAIGLENNLVYVGASHGFKPGGGMNVIKYHNSIQCWASGPKTVEEYKTYCKEFGFTKECAEPGRGASWAMCM